MVFSDVYNYFFKLCVSSFKKPKKKMYVIGKLADGLAFDQIFMKSGRELWRGNAFF